MRSKSNRRQISQLLAGALLRVFLRKSLRAADVKSQAKKDDAKTPESDPVYEPGGDVKPPKLVHYVEPAFSSASKEAFVEGTVKIASIIGIEGRATESCVVRGLNSEEDQTAIDAITKWRFDPGTKNGKPVRVKVTVEVDFHLL